MESPRHLTGGGTLAGLPHDLFESLAERRLGRQLLDLFHPHPAFRASQPMHLHHHGRPIYAPWQVSNLPLPHIVHTVQAATASAAFKAPVNGLAPHPQFQCLRLFVQFVPVHSVPRPRQNRRPFFVCQLPSVPKNCISLNHRLFECFHEFLRINRPMFPHFWAEARRSSSKAMVRSRLSRRCNFRLVLSSPS